LRLLPLERGQTRCACGLKGDPARATLTCASDEFDTGSQR
jgi:hypothetical protein